VDSPWLESKVFWISDTLLAPSMDGLDDEQRRAVHLLQEISNTTDDDVAVGVLSSVDWDIQVLLQHFLGVYISDRFEQKATEFIFGSAPVPSSSRVPEMQTFDIDDSHQGELGQLPDVQPRRRVC
jgi:FAS-associated factor 2